MKLKDFLKRISNPVPRAVSLNYYGVPDYTKLDIVIEKVVKEELISMTKMVPNHEWGCWLGGTLREGCVSISSYYLPKQEVETVTTELPEKSFREAIDFFREDGLELVGWHHSHHSLSPDPSSVDWAQAKAYSNLYKTVGVEDPFLCLITTSKGELTFYYDDVVNKCTAAYCKYNVENDLIDCATDDELLELLNEKLEKPVKVYNHSYNGYNAHNYSHTNKNKTVTNKGKNSKGSKGVKPNNTPKQQSHTNNLSTEEDLSDFQTGVQVYKRNQPIPSFLNKTLGEMTDEEFELYEEYFTEGL